THRTLHDALPISNQAQGDKPLYVLNGEEVTQTDPPDALSRMKTKYIKSIDVLKGEKAIDKYGEAGQNGVIEIQFLDEIDKVFSDLKEKPGPLINNLNDRAAGDFYVAVQQMPELIGGLKELQKKITYPEEAREAGDEGRVIVQFIVNEQGEVEEPKIIRGVSESLDQEALRVVKQAQFKPGKQRGQPVRVQYSLPIIFKLSSSISKKEPTVDVETPKMEGAEMKFENFQISDSGTLSGKVISTQEDSP